MYFPLTCYTKSVYYIYINNGKGTMNSKEIIKVLKKNGWKEIRVKGSHHHFAHDTKKGIVTVPHPKKDIPKGTLKSIEKQSGLTF